MITILVHFLLIPAFLHHQALVIQRTYLDGGTWGVASPCTHPYCCPGPALLNTTEHLAVMTLGYPKFKQSSTGCFVTGPPHFQCQKENRSLAKQISGQLVGLYSLQDINLWSYGNDLL